MRVYIHVVIRTTQVLHLMLMKTYGTAQMYSKRNATIHAMNSTAMVFFLPRNSIIRIVSTKPAYIRESTYSNHTPACIVDIFTPMYKR